MGLSDALSAMIITGGFAFLGGVIAILYKSKCTRIRCCRCIEIERDVAGEEKLDEEALHVINRDGDPAV